MDGLSITEYVDVREQARKHGLRLTSELALLPRGFERSSGMLVYMSSDYVFDGRAESFSKGDVLSPINHYGRTKVAGERYAQQAAKWLIVRGTFFGRWLQSQRDTRLEDQLVSLRQGDEVDAVADQIGTPLWTGTMAGVLLDLICSRLRGIHHAAGPTPVSKVALLRRVAIANGITSLRIRPVSTEERELKAHRPLNVVLRCSDEVFNYHATLPAWTKTCSATLMPSSFIP